MDLGEGEITYGGGFAPVDSGYGSPGENVWIIDAARLLGEGQDLDGCFIKDADPYEPKGRGRANIDK
jgi:hypothetical protein